MWQGMNVQFLAQFTVVWMILVLVVLIFIAINVRK